jgi:hypothetical protein
MRNTRAGVRERRWETRQSNGELFWSGTRVLFLTWGQISGGLLDKTLNQSARDSSNRMVNEDTSVVPESQSAA